MYISLYRLLVCIEDLCFIFKYWVVFSNDCLLFWYICY